MKLKKPKFWDYKRPNYISNLLLPLSKLLEFALKFKKRNKKKIGSTKTVCIGNIYLGGTGKTSMSIEIKKILDNLNFKSCFIKKQYSNQLDEQKLLNKSGKTFINKSRSQALIEANKENYEIAIFDDGLQDAEVAYDLSFVCFNNKNFIGNSRTIPAGPLREPLRNIKSYKNVFFVGNDENTENLEKYLKKFDMNLNFYNSKYKILNLSKFNLNDQFIVFSGIGNHYTFVEMLQKNKFKIFKDFEFPDHYNYNEVDINKIKEFAEQNNSKIITTHKDYLRLNEGINASINFAEIEIEITQLENLKKKLIDLIPDENN